MRLLVDGAFCPYEVYKVFWGTHGNSCSLFKYVEVKSVSGFPVRPVFG